MTVMRVENQKFEKTAIQTGNKLQGCLVCSETLAENLVNER